jgi:ABC-type Mn2+/Zn2+ transport system ATPase subunit
MALPQAAKPLPQPSIGASAPAVHLEGVSVRLGDRLALSDIDCSIAPGAFVGLLGPNGSGKSTLIRAILGVVPLARGRVLIDGREPAAARDLFAFLPQRQQVELNLPLRAWDVVMMGRLRHTGWFGAPKPVDKEAVTWALERVGLMDRRSSPIGEMSFGQQQRVFFARALAQEGRLLLLDEPMNGVDSKTQDLFVDLLGSFHAEGRTIIMSTHDLNMAACICDSLIILRQRLIASGPVNETFTPAVLQEAYGGHLHFLEAPALRGHAQVLEDVHHHETDSAGPRHAGLA